VEMAARADRTALRHQPCILHGAAMPQPHGDATPSYAAATPPPRIAGCKEKIVLLLQPARPALSQPPSARASRPARSLLYDLLNRSRPEEAMLDLAYVLATVAFFVAAWAYAIACDRV
jgi:hypothetical protein